MDEKGFLAELTALLNRHSKENASNTPDFILAEYLCACLAAWDQAVPRREAWFNRPSNEIRWHGGEPVGFTEPSQ